MSRDRNKCEVTEIERMAGEMDRLFAEAEMRKTVTKKHTSILKAEALYTAGYCKQEWISVKERLPDNHRMVLVVCESTSISAGALIAIGSYGGGFWSLGGADGTLYLTKYMQFVVSHWMELPEMPKGEKNA